MRETDLRPHTALALAFSVLLAIACGSGGPGSSVAPLPPPPPPPPAFTATPTPSIPAAPPTASAPPATATSVADGPLCCTSRAESGELIYWEPKDGKCTASDQTPTHGTVCEEVCCEYREMGDEGEMVSRFSLSLRGFCAGSEGYGLAGSPVETSRCSEPEKEVTKTTSSSTKSDKKGTTDGPMVRPDASSSGSGSRRTSGGAMTRPR